MSDLATNQINFDLACLWPGRLEPAASNDAYRTRPVPITTDTLVYLGDADPVRYGDWSFRRTTAATNAPGLPGTLPFWVFVNEGVVTEVAEYPDPINWSRLAGPWPTNEGVDGTVAPVSPTDPWPANGWPADGFYAASVEDKTETSLNLTLSKWLSCGDKPGDCLEWWTADMVYADPDLPTLPRTVSFDDDLAVVILPYQDQPPIVGSGTALRQLLTDLNDAMDEWIIVSVIDWYDPPPEVRALTSDPAFPFGFGVRPDYWLGYRGPGGAVLGPGESWNWWVLEVRDGLPFLYADAGEPAG